MLLLALLLALESLSLAASPTPVPVHQSLVLYRDCAPQKTPSVPVFTEWKDGAKNQIQEVQASSSYYSNGIEVSVLQDKSGQLTGLQFGDQISIPLSGFRPGVRFGTLNSVMHTLEADPGFDPKTGGVLRFGFFKDFGPSDVLHDLTISTRHWTTLNSVSSVSTYQKKLVGREWGEKKYRLTKKNGQWVLLDLKSSQQIYAIYTVMKTGTLFHGNGAQYPFLRMVTGLTNMVDEYVSGDPLQCRASVPVEMASKRKGRRALPMRSVIEDRESLRAFSCVSD